MPHSEDNMGEHTNNIVGPRANTNGTGPGNSDLPAAVKMSKPAARVIAFPAGNEDFRDARARAAKACQEFNILDEKAKPEERVAKWLDIVDPEHRNKPTADAVCDFAELFKNPDPDKVQSAAPYIKCPIHIDYGLRLKIGSTTFINRNFQVLDTPVADVIIGERCSISCNVTIISVNHPMRFEERLEYRTKKPASSGAKVVIEDGVWIGVNAVILPGVTIGEGSTIGAGSVVNKDIPARVFAAGNPAKVIRQLDENEPSFHYDAVAPTLAEALLTDAEQDEHWIKYNST